MKKVIGTLVIILFSVFSYAQEINQKNVPAVVLNAFQVKFPTAYDIDWRLEKGSYKVKFEVNNKDNWVIISDKGSITKHHQDLYVSEIPKEVLATIQSRVDFFDIGDADRLEEETNTTYYIDFEIRGKDYYFEVYANGDLKKFTKELRHEEIPTKITALITSKYGEYDLDYAKYFEEEEKITYYINGETNDKDHNFWFDGNATLSKRNLDLRNSEIPVAIQNKLKADYEGFEIRDADLIEEDGKTIYDLELRKSKERIHIQLNPKGKVLFEEKK